MRRALRGLRLFDRFPRNLPFPGALGHYVMYQTSVMSGYGDH